MHLQSGRRSEVVGVAEIDVRGVFEMQRERKCGDCGASECLLSVGRTSKMLYVGNSSNEVGCR